MSRAPFTWVGEESRPVRAYTYCPCATCQNSMPEGAVGFLSGSNADGVGFTIDLFSQDVYDILAELVGEAPGL